MKKICKRICIKIIIKYFNFYLKIHYHNCIIKTISIFTNGFSDNKNLKVR